MLGLLSSVCRRDAQCGHYSDQTWANNVQNGRATGDCEAAMTAWKAAGGDVNAQALEAIHKNRIQGQIRYGYVLKSWER